MTVNELVKQLRLQVFGGEQGLSNEITGGYTSDLLSDVMGHADSGKVWITLQTHKNVLGVASLKELAAVILIKNLQPDNDMLNQAQQEGIPILGTGKAAFEISGELYNLLKK